MANKFVADNGSRYTKSLFYEMTLADKTGVVYTLKNQDHKGYPSLYRLYMEMSDPTEYRFATTYLSDWQHWLILQKLHWFAPIVERWREELQLKIAADALTRILAEAQSDRREAFAANKYLLEKGWQPKDKVGRPSKEAIKREAALIVQGNDRLNDDWVRVGLENVSGT
jgi:hypothetical protein